MAKYAYPAIFTREGKGYSVAFPDIEGCFTCGDTLPEAMEMAEDALCLMLYDHEEDGEVIPTASDVKTAQEGTAELVSLVYCDTGVYRKLHRMIPPHGEKEDTIMPLPQENRYTLTDALAWDEQDRIELIYGDPVMMAPPTRAHQEAVTALVGQLYDYLKGKKCKVYAAPFAVRPFELDGERPEDVDTLVEPDITVVCDPSKLDDTGCKGAPDLVMEILSPSTTRHDRFTKFNLYQRAGVREYWIVDPADKSVQAFVLEDGRYTAKDFGAAGDRLRVNILEDCTIDLSQVFPE